MNIHEPNEAGGSADIANDAVYRPTFPERDPATYPEMLRDCKAVEPDPLVPFIAMVSKLSAKAKEYPIDTVGNYGFSMAAAEAQGAIDMLDRIMRENREALK